MSTVVDNPAEHRFELPPEGSDDEIPAAYYRMEDGTFILIHTKRPYQFTGQGVGSQLARGVLNAIHARGGKVVLRCPYMGVTMTAIPNIPTSLSARTDRSPVA